jgi:hypothetical protein
LTRLDASTVVGHGFPTDEGTRLAEALLEHPEFAHGFTVDLRGLPSALLIACFFSAVLQTIHDREPELLTGARNIFWAASYPFQTESIKRWMREFVPQ